MKFEFVTVFYGFICDFRFVCIGGVEGFCFLNKIKFGGKMIHFADVKVLFLEVFVGVVVFVLLLGGYYRLCFFFRDLKWEED